MYIRKSNTTSKKPQGSIHTEASSNKELSVGNRQYVLFVQIAFITMRSGSNDISPPATFGAVRSIVLHGSINLA